MTLNDLREIRDRVQDLLDTIDDKISTEEDDQLTDSFFNDDSEDDDPENFFA